MDLFGELKRRNVIRMAGLYLVGAWVLVQVSGTLLPVFEAPAWVMKTLVGLLALGFVPALVFSWLFELTPEGIKRDAEVTPEQSIASHTGRRMDRLIVGGLVVLVALTLANRFWPRAEPVAPAAGASRTAAPATPEPAVDKVDAAAATATPSIAVLPIVNMSADAENQYISDGIPEELLNVRAKVDGIGVASRTSSFAYKGKDADTATIAKALKVDHILEGSVRKSGKQVRITAQLIDAVHDRHLWSETYDRELTDIFKIQDEIANAIVAALRGSLGAANTEHAVTVKADTDNLDAYQMYLKARGLFVTRADVKESIRLSEQIVRMDPKFARAWENLAAAYAVAPSWMVKDRDFMAPTRAAANRALELDPSLSMPWAAIAMSDQYGRHAEWGKDIELIDKALAADPKNATAYLWRATFWMNLGFFDRAFADTEQCLKFDPAYLNCTRWQALALLQQGRTDEAMARFERGVADGFVPNRADSFVPVLARRGDRLAARLLLERLGVKPELAAIFIEDMGRGGASHPDAEALVARNLPQDQRGFALQLGRAKAYLWLGAFDLEVADPDNNTDQLVAWERFPPAFRGSAAFKRTLANLGVDEYWREHGYPPQCHAAGDKDFACDPLPAETMVSRR